jgi:hypothetical protein
MVFENLVESFFRCVTFNIEIEIEYGVGFPIPSDGIDIKPLEKFSFPFEKTFHSREKKAFHKTSRTSEKKILPSVVDNLLQETSLIDI